MRIEPLVQAQRWGCPDCMQRFDSLPALFDHSQETGHGKLPRSAPSIPTSRPPEDADGQ